MPTSRPTPKQQLRSVHRARRRARRDAAGPQERSADAEGIARHALELAARWTDQPGVATAYESWPVEPPTERLIDVLREHGWRVIVPITLPDLDLSWRKGGDETDLGRDAIGQASLVLVPATAVDLRGRRLGQGGGCYDRALPRRRPGTRIAAIVWDDEIVDDVPTQPHDIRVDAIVTPRRLVMIDS